MVSTFHLRGITVDMNRFAETLGKRKITNYINHPYDGFDLSVSLDDIDPDDVSHCITYGNLKQKGLGLEDVKSHMIEALIRDPELALVYQRSMLPEAVEGDFQIPLSRPDLILGFDVPGETWTINFKGVICPNGRIHSVDPYGNDDFVSVYAFFQPTREEPSTTFEVTHIQGSNGEPHLYIPVHIAVPDEDGDSSSRLSVLELKLKLPPAQEKEDVIRLSATTKSVNEPGFIDLKEYGLKAHDKTFCTMQPMYYGPHRQIYSGPRDIGGLAIKPTNNGSMLSVSSWNMPKELDSKTIWTHLINKDDEIVPVELTVNFF